MIDQEQISKLHNFLKKHNSAENSEINILFGDFMTKQNQMFYKAQDYQYHLKMILILKLSHLKKVIGKI